MKVEKIYYGINCNTYLLGNKGEKCIVVDPGYNPKNALINHIKKFYSGVEGILLTHAHYDHITGLNDIAHEFNSKVYIHENEINILFDKRLNLSEKDNLVDEKIDIIPLMDNETIELLGEKIKVIHTPFHTSGSCCYYFSNSNQLFSGDTLFHLSIGRFDLPTATPRTITSSLDKLKRLPIETNVYPGHECSTTIGNELEFNRYLKK